MREANGSDNRDLSSDVAILACLNGQIARDDNRRHLESHPELTVLSPRAQDLFWQPMRTLKFEESVFEEEPLYNAVFHLAYISHLDQKNSVIKAYSCALILHAYATRYHWNSLNQPDNYVILGHLIQSLMALDHGTMFAAARFVGWLQENNRVNVVIAIYQMSNFMINALLAATSVRMLLSEADAHDYLGLEHIAGSKRWVLRMDLNANGRDIENAWEPLVNSLRSRSGLQGLLSVFFSKWDER